MEEQRGSAAVLPPESPMKGCPVVRDDPIEAEYAKPLPWIGLYIAFFSLLCAGAMVIDAYRAFRRLKFWFPCRFFSLNAATLAFLTIATKLPVDLNTSMPQATDQLTKLAGTVFLCIATGNFLPSLGDMDSSTVFSNVLALAILIFIVIANIIIQIITGVIYVFVPEHCVIIALLILHLFVFISAAIAIPSAKENLENVFERKIGEPEFASPAEFISLDRLRGCVNELWLMAHSASPQYIIGRSVVSAASGFFCFAAGGILIEALLRGLIWKKSLELCEGKSDYSWSIVVVLIAQSVAIIIGCIAPVSRWIGAVSLRGWSWKEMFKLEDHWIQLLVSWKESPLKVEHHNGITTILPHQIKLFALSLSIFLQKAVVLLSKASRLLLVRPLSFIVDHLSSTRRSFARSDYVLFLEGEENLVDLITRCGRRETERWIQKGRREKPYALENLMQNSSTRLRGFTEVGAFLHDPAPNNCWALPLVTLAAIAAALFSDSDESIESLLRAVGEGLRYVRLVDTHLDTRGLVNSIKAADMIWMDVRLYNKWLEEDLRKKVGENRATEVLKRLEEKATDVLKGFTGESCPEWPEKVLAADCMKTACARIRQDDGQRVSFERMSTVVADILGACLLNLPKALFHGCICCKVEVREKTVMDAARILGEAEGLLNLIEKSPVDRVSPENRPYIDKWTNGRSSAEPESGCVASSLQGTVNFSQADAVSDEV